MDTASLQIAAGANQWAAILPEIVLACLALLLLVLEIVLPKKHHDFIPALAILGQATLLLGVLINVNSYYVQDGYSFNHLLHHSFFGQMMRVFFILSSILVCVLGRIALPRQSVSRIEFYHIVMIVAAAMMLLAQSNNFLMLFVALETVTVGFYILVSYFRSSPASLEAGLKYLIMGALSSGMLLFGIALLYGTAGNPLLAGHATSAMDFDQLRVFLIHNPNTFLGNLGIVLVLAGVAFKVGAFPFQIWIPDVYQGAPTPITAFLAVASKAAGFVVLVNLCGTGGVFSGATWLTTPVLSVMAAATILFGNLAALAQSNVKRLIGLSGVSHAGFLLLAVVAAPKAPLAMGAIYFYLYAYLFASFTVFGVMAHLAGPDDASQEIEHYSGLAKEHPFLAGVLTIGLGSLAGIPPLAGFMGKLFVFIAAFQAGLYWLLGVAVLGVVISIAYYFGWVRGVYFDAWWNGENQPNGRPAVTPVNLSAGIALGALAAFTIILGFYQGVFGTWLTP